MALAPLLGRNIEKVVGRKNSRDNARTLEIPLRTALLLYYHTTWPNQVPRGLSTHCATQANEHITTQSVYLFHYFLLLLFFFFFEKIFDQFSFRLHYLIPSSGRISSQKLLAGRRHYLQSCGLAVPSRDFVWPSPRSVNISVFGCRFTPGWHVSGWMGEWWLQDKKWQVPYRVFYLLGRYFVPLA